MFKRVKENKKGFTLAELLIVVAIIAVLVAISIPIFNSQLEKSREATDAANIRAAYAQVQAGALMQESKIDFENGSTADITYTATIAEGSNVYQAEVSLKQKQDEWQSGAQDIGGVSIAANDAKANGKATVKYDQASGETTITMSTN